MRSIRLSLLGVVLATGFASTAHADLVVLAPGVVQNGGVTDVTAEFTKATGIKVTLKGGGMSTIVDTAATADIVFLPMEPYNLLGNLALKGGIKDDSFTPIGRVEFGLAFPAGKPKPDISTVPKFIAVLETAKGVMRSNPGNDLTPGRGSMVALLIDQMVKKPEFAKVHTVISTGGEGGQALAKGQGDMALQAINEIINHPELELVGPIPPELYVHMDMAAAVTAGTKQEKDARAYIAFIMKPEMRDLWKKKALDRF